MEFTIARLREFIREPGAVFWVFVFPVLLAVGLGIAFRERPPDAWRVGVIADGPPAERARALLSALEGVVVEPLDAAAGVIALRNGRLDLLVRAAATAAPTDPAPALTWRYDPQRPESRAARVAVDDALQRHLGRRDVTATVEEHATEPGGRYIDFLIPGLIGLNVMNSGLWGIGYTVVLARRRRLLRRLAVTPMQRPHFLLSYMLSRLLFMLPEVASLVLFGWLVFDVAVRGSLLGVAGVSFVGSLSFVGIALLVASRTDSTEVASGWMNAVMLPMYVLSGAFFSYERFPEVFHPAIRALPLTAFNDALRAIMNDGASLLATWPQLLVLAAWGGLASVLALRWFRWQ